MRSTGPSGHCGSAEGRYQVARADAARVRGQFCPEVAVLAGYGQCPDGRPDVVFGLATLPLPPDGEHAGSEHLLHPLLQLLIRHAEHLQLPIARCYLLLERTLRFSDQGSRLDGDPLGQQRAQRGREIRHWDLPRPGGVEAQVEVLAARLTPGGEGQAEADERVRDEPL